MNCIPLMVVKHCFSSLFVYLPLHFFCHHRSQRKQESPSDLPRWIRHVVIKHHYRKLHSETPNEPWHILICHIDNDVWRQPPLCLPPGGFHLSLPSPITVKTEEAAKGGASLRLGFIPHSFCFLMHRHISAHNRWIESPRSICSCVITAKSMPTPTTPLVVEGGGGLYSYLLIIQLLTLLSHHSSCCKIAHGVVCECAFSPCAISHSVLN